MLAPLAFMFFFSFRIHAISAATAQTLFWVFCALIGLSLAAVFLVFTGTSIARTFFITAAMFGTTSFYGYTTKRDLSSMGSCTLTALSISSWVLRWNAAAFYEAVGMMNGCA